MRGCARNRATKTESQAPPVCRGVEVIPRKTVFAQKHCQKWRLHKNGIGCTKTPVTSTGSFFRPAARRAERPSPWRTSATC
jgi:hypothetical protein